jgi:tetratricopeptide (TPR) repeat protein
MGFEAKRLAGAILARNLWLQGYPSQALERARRTVQDAASMDHPLTLCIALVWAISVFLWTGDLQSAEEHIDRLMSGAEANSLTPYLAVGRGFRGELAIRRADAEGGVGILQRCLKDLHAAPYKLLTTPLNISLVQGLAAIGQFADGFTLVDQTIRLVQENGDFCYMPELLRLKGGLLLLRREADRDEARNCLSQSLELSRRQAARAWELRTAVDLAALLARQGLHERARALLRPVFEEFREGFETADLKAAERLLVALGTASQQGDHDHAPRPH